MAAIKHPAITSVSHRLVTGISTYCGNNLQTEGCLETTSFWKRHRAGVPAHPRLHFGPLRPPRLSPPHYGMAAQALMTSPALLSSSPCAGVGQGCRWVGASSASLPGPPRNAGRGRRAHTQSRGLTRALARTTPRMPQAPRAAHLRGPAKTRARARHCRQPQRRARALRRRRAHYREGSDKGDGRKTTLRGWGRPRRRREGRPPQGRASIGTMRASRRPRGASPSAPDEAADTRLGMSPARQAMRTKSPLLPLRTHEEHRTKGTHPLGQGRPHPLGARALGETRGDAHTHTHHTPTEGGVERPDAQASRLRRDAQTLPGAPPRAGSALTRARSPRASDAGCRRLRPSTSTRPAERALSRS